MTKKAKILVSLVKESIELSNDELATEIFTELLKFPQVIPWVEKVLVVSVNDD
ncbi:MAG: hypothetical protein NWF06_00175 [Candidatus Bathyarchaeota archaeon]|nr:hypothetical protein [Candidatus Bathyarchaeum sp.]